MKMPTPRYFPCSVIARAVRHDKKTIMRQAACDGWPRRKRGNRFELQPPLALRKACLRIFQRVKDAGLRRFSIGPERCAEVFRAEIRFAAVCALETALLAGAPIERTLGHIVRDFTFKASPNSLRRWQRQFADEGFVGLLESKRGHSGRKGRVLR